MNYSNKQQNEFWDWGVNVVCVVKGNSIDSLTSFNL